MCMDGIPEILLDFLGHFLNKKHIRLRPIQMGKLRSSAPTDFLVLVSKGHSLNDFTEKSPETDRDPAIRPFDNG